MRSSPFSRATLVVALALLVNACTPTPVPTDTPTKSTLPSGWQRIEGQNIPAIAPAAQQLPATVLSDDEVEVTITDTSRIIAGGDDVIAVIDALHLSQRVYAAPERSATQTGRDAPLHFLFNRNTGAEGVLSLEASLFIGNSLRRHALSGLATKLRDAGLATVIVDDLQPAPDKVRKVAALLGLPKQGEALAQQIQAQLDEATTIGQSHTHKPRVIQVSASGAGGRPTVAGRDNAAAELIRLAGGINIGDEAGVANYSELSHEGVVAADPEIVLVTEQDLELFGGEDGLWRAYPTLRQTPAGQANRVWIMPDLQLKATSVASGAGAIALAQALAELAAQAD